MTSFEILPGLPTDGPPALPFPDDSDARYSEGFVVRFYPRSGEPWVGNFAAGFGTLSNAFAHPDRKRMVVVASGAAYVIDVETRECVDTIGRGMVEHAIELPSREMLVLGDTLELVIVTPNEWTSTRRISWDGMQNLDTYGNEIRGEAWSAPEEAWHAFRLDLDTLEVSGGGY